MISMKLTNNGTTGLWISLPSSLEAVFLRLKALSRAPQFVAQRELALGRALEAYLSATASPLAPLEQEIHLAELVLYADFYPEDGQLTLIEQLRDVITEHIPDEERQWLDPLKHSYMDLVEVLPTSESEVPLTLRSMGDGRRYHVSLTPSALKIEAGQVVLTRLIRESSDPESEKATIAGSGLILAADDAKIFYESVSEYRRQLELAGGSFALGNWQEFAKRFGHLLLVQFARMRMAALVVVITHIRYVSADGRPYLYAIALYEHHEVAYLAQSLSDIDGFRVQPPPAEMVSADPSNPPCRTWSMAASSSRDAAMVARVTLTPSQLWVECDSGERLDAVKHALAAAYGFSLHFRGETVTPPRHELSANQLTAGQPVVIPITVEEDRALLREFLETTYLEWADQESPALGGKTPRHAVTSAADRQAVEALIAGMERHDLGLYRTGARVFDYNKLRAHVGLEESRE
jgi:hypothetical protein